MDSDFDEMERFELVTLGFEAAVSIDASGTWPATIAADLDGDTLLDGVAYDVTLGAVVWYAALGKGNFNPRQAIASNPVGSFRALDFDPDGAPEIVALASGAFAPPRSI